MPEWLKYYISSSILLFQGCAEGYARDATEIQNIQIADGDVCRNLPIPIYMVFPRLFTCPTLETTNFKVGEEPLVTISKMEYKGILKRVMNWIFFLT